MNKHQLRADLKASYRTLPEMITGALREDILSGGLSAGTQLKQEELASKFGVSMSALREALKSLEAEGLVTFYPNRGAVVSALSADEAQEIFDIRLFLEMGALELAIPNLTDADLTLAADILDKADQEQNPQNWGELNRQFHGVLYQAANRPKLFSLIQTLHNNVERYMRLYLSTLHYQTQSQKEHRLLLQACVRREVKTAQELLRSHMLAASLSLTGYLRR